MIPQTVPSTSEQHVGEWTREQSSTDCDQTMKRKKNQTVCRKERAKMRITQTLEHEENIKGKMWDRQGFCTRQKRQNRIEKGKQTQETSDKPQQKCLYWPNQPHDSLSSCHYDPSRSILYALVRTTKKTFIGYTASRSWCTGGPCKKCQAGLESFLL